MTVKNIVIALFVVFTSVTAYGNVNTCNSLGGITMSKINVDTISLNRFRSRVKNAEGPKGVLSKNEFLGSVSFQYKQSSNYHPYMSLDINDEGLYKDLFDILSNKSNGKIEIASFCYNEEDNRLLGYTTL